MKITIHRGIDQIGGCITEIASAAGVRVLIDLGQNLPDGEGVVRDELATGEAIEALTRGVNAIFYTHYHGDHIGLFHLLPDDMSQYVGTVAKRVTLCKHRQLARIEDREQQAKIEIAKLERMGELAPGYSVIVGDIQITPYFVSHSAYDSYMFLIEADGRRVLHTGDFRGHGYLSKALMPIIEKRILRDGPVDFLITEGTMLSRAGEKAMTENELQREATKLMRRYRNVFVMCSSTDMERLASFHAAHRGTGRGPLVCDKFQKKILTIFRETAGKHSRLFRFDKVYDFRHWNDKVLDWMSQEGFCMFVRATDKFAEWWRMLAPRLDPAETVLIYSMWSGYVTPDGPHAVPRYLDFVSQFPHIKRLHTSGHASPEILAEVCRAVNPALGIIPIHSEHPAAFADLPIGDELRARVITASTIVNGVCISVEN